MSGGPQIRALTSQVALERIDRLKPPLRDAILGDAGDVSVARDAFQFSFIPFPIQIRILDAMRRHLTPVEWRESQRALMLGYLDKPVLRGLFDTAVRMLGLSVSTCCRWAPRAYDALFKNAGSLRYEPGPGPREGTLVLDAFPRALFSSGSFHDSMQAAFEVIYTLTKTEGTVTTADLELSSGHARYVMKWAE